MRTRVDVQRGRDVSAIWALSAPRVWSEHPQLMPREAPRLPALPALGKQPCSSQGTQPQPKLIHPAAEWDIPPWKKTPAFHGSAQPPLPYPCLLGARGEERGRLIFSCLNEEQGNPKVTPDACADLLTQRAFQSCC